MAESTSLEDREDQVKKSLLAEINHNLVAAGVVAADGVFVMITEIGRARVSFGGGAAPGSGLSRSAEATEQNVKQIAVKRPTAESNAHPVFQFSGRRNRTTGPWSSPGYGATNLGGHWDDRIRRHAAVQPHEHSGDPPQLPGLHDACRGRASTIRCQELPLVAFAIAESTTWRDVNAIVPATSFA
jgi:hypothetical protein